MFKVEKVGADSAQTLAHLWVETFTQAYADVHTPENIRAYCTANFTVTQACAELADQKTDCAIAYQNGESVGFYLIKHHACPTPLDGGSSELKQIYILANQFGSGLGKALYAEALDSIRAEGLTWVWLCVSDINHLAKAFYKKLGFSPVGTGPTFEVGSDRLPSTILAKPI